MPKPKHTTILDDGNAKSKLPWLKPVDPRRTAVQDKCVDFVCISQVKDILLNYIHNLWEEFQAQSGSLSREDGLRAWMVTVQKERPEEYLIRNDVTFEDFKQYLTSEWANALKDSPPDDRLYDHPMTDYFISSSHNTYLIGNQLYGHSTADGYKIALLSGCRCVEIDVWDGQTQENTDLGQNLKTITKTPPGEFERPELRKAITNLAEPIVLHGYTATRMVPFRDVCDAIRTYAFVSSELPVIVSLEVHTNREQQQLMVDIMHESFKGMLCDPTDLADDMGNLKSTKPELPSPSALLRKILIKVKYSPPKPESDEAPLPGSAEQERTGSNENVVTSLPDSDDEAAKVIRKPEKPSKVIDALSQMGVYTRSCHFKSFSQAEAALPTHVFSLSETTLLQIHKTNPDSLFKHNQNFFMRAFPRGLRISSSNLDPALFWRLGVQMVALNWQTMDAGMMLNEAMFANTEGWVLKPEGYRTHSIPSQASQVEISLGTSRLSVEFFAGQDIPTPKGVEDAKFHPYIKCELHVESDFSTDGRAKDGEYKQSTKQSSGCDPDFKREVLRFDNIPALTPALSFVRFKVMQGERFARDEMVAWACIRLDRLGSGYRFVHLFDSKGMQTKGVILVRIDYSWKVKDIAVPVPKESNVAASEGKGSPKKSLADMEHKILHGFQKKLSLQ